MLAQASCHTSQRCFRGPFLLQAFKRFGGLLRLILTFYQFSTGPHCVKLAVHEDDSELASCCANTGWRPTDPEQLAIGWKINSTGAGHLEYTKYHRPGSFGASLTLAEAHAAEASEIEESILEGLAQSSRLASAGFEWSCG